jgi:hypothetical protein
MLYHIAQTLRRFRARPQAATTVPSAGKAVQSAARMVDAAQAPAMAVAAKVGYGFCFSLTDRWADSVAAAVAVPAARLVLRSSAYRLAKAGAWLPGTPAGRKPGCSGRGAPHVSFAVRIPARKPPPRRPRVPAEQAMPKAADADRMAAMAEVVEQVRVMRRHVMSRVARAASCSAASCFAASCFAASCSAASCSAASCSLRPPAPYGLLLLTTSFSPRPERRSRAALCLALPQVAAAVADRAEAAADSVSRAADAAEAAEGARRGTARQALAVAAAAAAEAASMPIVEVWGVRWAAVQQLVGLCCMERQSPRKSQLVRRRPVAACGSPSHAIRTWPRLCPATPLGRWRSLPTWRRRWRRWRRTWRTWPSRPLRCALASKGAQVAAAAYASEVPGGARWQLGL